MIALRDKPSTPFPRKHQTPSAHWPLITLSGFLCTLKPHFRKKTYIPLPCTCPKILGFSPWERDRAAWLLSMKILSLNPALGRRWDDCILRGCHVHVESYRLRCSNVVIKEVMVLTLNWQELCLSGETWLNQEGWRFLKIVHSSWPV